MTKSGDVHTALDDDVCYAMAEQHLDGDLRVLHLGVGKVHNSPCDTVCHLVRMARIHFFLTSSLKKHVFYN